ncbi:MAG TPA: hypothetical protein VFG20_05290 [Planctomycetaceae bacterium]|nr:hypothetical protein [Planctomycetaceae bacterium]
MNSKSIAIAWCLVGVTLATASAQPKDAPVGKVRSTTVEVELLTSPEGGILHGQQWRAQFEQLGVSLKVKRAALNDKPQISERIVGTLRFVTAVGQVERSGRISFPGKAFTFSDGPKLKEWIDELKTYGAEGSPHGKPLWGLTEKQFKVLYGELSAVQKTSVAGKDLPDSVTALELPDHIPVRWSLAAQDHLERRVAGKQIAAIHDTTGFSKATVLAIALNDQNLGFRPNRTPEGTIELLIEPQSADRQDHWPVGWPLQQQQSALLPNLFLMVNVSLEKLPASEVLDEVAKATETPVFVDRAEFERRDIDLTKLLLSHPLKKTTWSMALRSMLVPKRITREYWQDEGGRGFVWITATGKPRADAVKGVGGNPNDRE